MIVAFEADLYDGSRVRTLRLAHGMMSATVDDERVDYEPALNVPILLGARISAEQPGQAVAGVPNGGAISFAINPDIRTWLDFSYEGRPFRLWEGDDGATDRDELTLVYVGRLIGLTINEAEGTASFATTDAGVDLDKPAIENLYGEKVTQESQWMLGASMACSGTLVVFSAGDLIAAGVRAGDTHIWTEGLAADCLDIPLLVEDVDERTITYDQVVTGASGEWSFSRPVPSGLLGRVVPYIWGQVYSAEPDLIDEAELKYHLSFRRPIEVDEVRIGGIPWDYADPPGVGQWYVNTNGGWIILGGTPLGGEIRCDVKGYGWETCTTGSLVEELVTVAGGSVDSAAKSALDVTAPQLIGLQVREPASRAEIIDAIMQAIGGWRAPGNLGPMTMGLIAEPEIDPVATYTDVEIVSCSRTEVVAPAWQIRVEHSRNWQPGSQFYDAVTEEEQQAAREGGIVAEPYKADAVKTAYPRAVDVPLIRSLVVSEDDALAIRARLSAAYGVERRVYDLVLHATPPDLYSTVAIEYGEVSGRFRVISAIRSIGGGASQIRVWG